MRQVLVLCTANRCRSPLVGELLAQRVRAAGLADQIQVVTGGLFAEPGIPADAEVVELLARDGMDAAAHRSQPVHEAMLRRADVILVMEEAHRQAIFHRAPAMLAKVLLYAELAQRHEDIPDAHGQAVKAYQELYGLVQEILELGWPRLVARLKL